MSRSAGPGGIRYGKGLQGGSDAAFRSPARPISGGRHDVDMKMKDFETNLKQLEEIVSKLEGGELTLDQALALFEEGVKLSRYCNAKLEEAERKVETLIKSADGSLVETPFTPAGDEAPK
jgi:exodeoxyribonuclease VII small subunit